jgi:hypothetical protein
VVVYGGHPASAVVTVEVEVRVLGQVDLVAHTSTPYKFDTKYQDELCDDTDFSRVTMFVEFTSKQCVHYSGCTCILEHMHSITDNAVSVLTGVGASAEASNLSSS